MLYSVVYQFIFKVHVKKRKCIGMSKQRRWESKAADSKARKKLKTSYNIWLDNVERRGHFTSP
jgi:hypothetical protein